MFDFISGIFEFVSDVMGWGDPDDQRRRRGDEKPRSAARTILSWGCFLLAAAIIIIAVWFVLRLAGVTG